MRYENSCVYYFTRCIRGNITEISFSFFWSDIKYSTPIPRLRLRIHDCPFGIKTGERHAKFHKFFIIWTSYSQRLYITDASMRSLCRDAEGNLNFWGRGRDMHNKFFWASSKIPRNISNRSNFPLFAYFLFSFLSFSTHFYNIGFVLFWNFYIQLMEELCAFSKCL